MGAFCRGCHCPIIWARHIKTEKPAPLVYAKDDEVANIFAAPVPPDMSEWKYRIATAEDLEGGIKPLFLNHFSNCPARQKFKTEKAEKAGAPV
jgi:hypothetical protein